MKIGYYFLTLLCVAQVASGSVASSAHDTSSDESPKIGAYINGRSIRNGSIDRDQIAKVDWVYLAGLQPNSETGGFFHNDLGYTKADGRIFISYDEFNSTLKIAKDLGKPTSVMLGGAGSHAAFEAIAASPKRDAFIHKVRDFCLEMGLDGIDIDYEHPKSEEKIKLMAMFYKRCYEVWKPAGLRVSAAFSARRSMSLDLAQRVQPYVDTFNFMTYGAPAANLKNYVTSFRKLGIPDQKVVLGIAFFGKGTVNGKKYEVPYSKLTKSKDFDSAKSIVEYDHPIAGKLAITYTNQAEMKKIAQLPNELGVAGIMFWEMGSDIPVSESASLLKSLVE